MYGPAAVGLLRGILDCEGIPVVIWLNRNEAEGFPMLILTGDTTITYTSYSRAIFNATGRRQLG